jgi:uncharacterized protein YuzE
MATPVDKKLLRYPRMAMRAHYDPEVDIALLSFEQGNAVSEEHCWGLVDRDPANGRLMGLEIWEAGNRLPPELVAALPTGTQSAHAP